MVRFVSRVQFYTKLYNWKKGSSSPRKATVFVSLSVCLSVRAKRGMEYKSVNQKEKEISVLVFVQIDLIQIEYWNHFTYKSMWYDLYHVSNFIRSCFMPHIVLYRCFFNLSRRNIGLCCCSLVIYFRFSCFLADCWIYMSTYVHNCPCFRIPRHFFLVVTTSPKFYTIFSSTE